jgi:hypothetical protein
MDALGRVGRGALWGAGIAIVAPLVLAVAIPSMQSLAARGFSGMLVLGGAALGMAVVISNMASEPPIPSRRRL